MHYKCETLQLRVTHRGREGHSQKQSGTYRTVGELPSAQAHRGDCQVMPQVLGRPLA